MQDFAENLIKSPPKLADGKPIDSFGTFHYFHRTVTLKMSPSLGVHFGELEACANGESAAPISQDGPSATPPEEPSIEGDIYDDVEMLIPTKLTDLNAGQAPESVPPAGGPPLKLLESVSVVPSSSLKHQPEGPPRRVVILTSQPPTFKGTTFAGIGLARGEQTEEAKGESVQPRAELTSLKVSETQTCEHTDGLTGDPHRPPGVALWAFGYTEWSCDTNYEALVTIPPSNGPKGNRPEAPVPIRFASNQRGQQWERNPVPYVHVPPTWRAFDEEFVIDVKLFTWSTAV
ncbi:unnamed protein product [Rhizoctonia solani]|uniref:Uncharacterized protein n=1 Tax=Rhizoctonia solani TaxID=456999 RepID=A0A8H2XE02_9AGAM|nr:unnamed protein product [Rhizoctonia solani]